VRSATVVATVTAAGMELGGALASVSIRALARALPHTPPLSLPPMLVAALAVGCGMIVACAPVLRRVLRRDISRILQEP